MVNYKLTYFNVRGRAEPIRYIFAQSGVTYDDNRISQEEWAKLKHGTPMGQVPLLEADGKQLCQSMSIARYLAKEFGLVPANNWDAAKADMLVDGVSDLFTSFVPIIKAIFANDEHKKAEEWAKFKNEGLKTFSENYERFLKGNGGKFFVGDKLSWADIIIGEMVKRLMDMSGDGEALFKQYPHVLDHSKRLHDLPNVKKYVASRPETPL